ncbi:hypothetical protein SPFM1_00134 [Salmonella phage SPFM1]|nr:hypothetical protein SPFM1_00134 [Salmonella phage SPFM1]
MSNSVGTVRPMATTAEQVEEPISPIVVGEPNADSIRPLAVEVATTDAPRPLDVEGDVVWRVRVIPNVPSPQPYWWPVLEEINKDDIVLPLAEVQRCNMRGGSVEWVTLTDTTLTRTTVFFTQQLLTGGNPVMWLISQLGDGSTGGDWANDTKTHYYRVSVPVSPDLSKATPYPDGIEPVDQALIVTKTENNTTWTALYQAGAVFGTGDAGPWLKFFKDGKIVYLPTTGTLTVAELNNLIRPDVAPTKMTFELAGDSTNGYFGHVSQQELFTYYLNEAVGYYPDSGPGNKYLSTRINLTAYNSVCYRGYIPVVWLSDSSVQSVDAPIKSLATLPQTAKTVRDLLPALRDLYGAVYYDRLTLSDLFKIAPRVYGRNTVITLVGKPGKGFSGECRRISADSIGVRGVPAETTKNGAPELELLCQQVVRDNPELAAFYCGT